jgi:hypothetical protein
MHPTVGVAMHNMPRFQRPMTLGLTEGENTTSPMLSHGEWRQLRAERRNTAWYNAYVRLCAFFFAFPFFRLDVDIFLLAAGASSVVGGDGWLISRGDVLSTAIGVSAFDSAPDSRPLNRF